jgi:acetyl esterase/lipase
MEFSRRAFGQAAAMALAGAATGGRALAQAGDPLALVAPELRPFAQRMLAAGQAEFSDATLAKIRASAAASPPALRPDVPVERRTAPVRPGWADVTVYVFNARPGAGRPGILHLHGGGFVGGSARLMAPRIQALAAALDCTVVSVDYSLAPEARYDVSTEETYAGLKWMFRESEALGVDRRRIAILGESAGGCHAALLAFAARDRGEVPVTMQVLIYPGLDDRTGSTRPLPPHYGAVGWGPANNRFAWRSFLGMEPGGPGVPAAAVPARRQDLAGLPPAFIGVGGIDLLVSEDIDYARRLLEAGVPTELHVTPGAFHGFDHIAADTSLARAFNAAKIEALRRAFAA